MAWDVWAKYECQRLGFSGFENHMRQGCGRDGARGRIRSSDSDGWMRLSRLEVVERAKMVAGAEESRRLCERDKTEVMKRGRWAGNRIHDVLGQ